jgi:ABC-type transport system involved in multi-copper enzyme maturation permease subunit
MITAPTNTPPPPTMQPRCQGFGPPLRAEWTKFRTVRGWLIGVLVAALLSVLFTFLVANGNHEGSCTGPPPPSAGPNSPGSHCRAGHPFVPTGPNGQPVADSYQFVEQPLTGNITLTARVSALTGVISTNPSDVAPSLTRTRPELTAWAKAGILLTPSTRQGSPYAAIMATGSHGIRWQYNYTHDSAGLPGSISDTSPHWLRLTRSGDTLTGYDSPNGTTWTQIGTAHLAGLPATVTVGLFVTSPVSFQDSNSGSPTQATAAFDHVSIQNPGRASAANAWHGQSIGSGSASFYPTLASGSYHIAGSAFVLDGSGDIAPGVGEGLLGGNTAASTLPVGLIAALLAMIVVATTYITTEYRRGLIRTTLAATPRRHRVLVAKAVVIGVVAFVTIAISAAVAIPLAEHILNTNGNYVVPTSTPTEVRIIAGAAALVAVTAVAVLALGTILRKSAGAVAAGSVVFILPYILGQFLSSSAQEWLFRLTPAAGFAVLGALPRSAQVTYPYTFENGYYPLAPWAGLAVLCAWAALALGVAAIALRRRDA